jgi:fatty acid desaturase
MQPTHGFRIYHLNHHDFMWIWYPEDTETFDRPKRIVNTFFALYYVFLFMFYFNDMVAYWADNRLNERIFLSQNVTKRFAGGATLTFLLRFLLADAVAIVFR